MSEENVEYLKLCRNDLKERFKAGRMPTEEDFMSLIDSMVNCMDEGFDVTEENGLEIKQKKDGGRLASFFANLAEHKPQWFIDVRKNTEKNESRLNLRTPNLNPEESAMTVVSMRSEDADIKNKTRVGIGIATPKCALDVNGAIASKGRLGYENDKYDVPADGEWHDVTDVLSGCHCYEIVAGVGGNEGDGKFAIAHAIATNAFNCHPSVKLTHSYSGGRGSRIDIRFCKSKNKYEYTLQLRTHHKYDDSGKIKVRYRLTKLWYDTQMLGSIAK